MERLTKFDRLYTNEALLSNSSEMHLAEQQDAVPDLLPTQENNVSQGKGTENSETDKETEQKFNKGERFLLASGAEGNANANVDANPNPNGNEVEDFLDKNYIIKKTLSNFVDSLVDYLRYGTKEKRTVQFREDATQTNTIGEIDDTSGDIRGRNDQSEGGQDREYLRVGRGVQDAETSRNGERLYNDNLVGRHYGSEGGRDRETEESDRRGKKGNDRENHGQPQEKLGQDVQADRHRRTVDVAQDGRLHEEAARCVVEQSAQEYASACQ